MIRTQLIDRRNAHLIPAVCAEIAAAGFIGLDCETHDADRHEGLNLLMKVDAEGFKAGNTKLVFDMRRITMTGFSVYAEGSQTAYYFNLAHADVENRLEWNEIQCVLDAKSPSAYWLSHNAPFELTVFAKYGYQLTNVICTLQLAVTAFGSDNYDVSEWRAAGLGGMAQLLPALISEEDRDEAIGKITSKVSSSRHSYNGFVSEVAYSHGLKQLVLKFFDHKMSSFADTLGEEAHMGKVTGDQVAEYGAEDAYWVVPLFRHLLSMVAQNSPNALNTFFTQENPMAEVYSELWRGGMKVDLDKIEARRDEERVNFANLLRDLRRAMRSIPWGEPNAELARREKWYANNWQRYRTRISAWVNLPDTEDDLEEACRVSNAVPNAWRTDGLKVELSITHYMVTRTIFYDLLGAPIQFDRGKVASDGEARGKIISLLPPTQRAVVEILGQMASVEQRMKLYLTPYMLLTDPETGRLYPTVNSMLTTRRIAASTPNPMQLAKRGESTYVRGFFTGDTDEHMVVSLDWSAIELVIIGELSKDPEFKKAFGQLPHEDLHTGATAAILQVEMPWLTEDHIHALKRMPSPDAFRETYGLTQDDTARLFTNLKGEPITDCGKARGYWRTEIGKGANFNYWYSGFLATVGERMGWSMDTTSTATDRYRNKFPVAEDWRVGIIADGQRDGFAELPDGHRRFRFEATDQFLMEWNAKWPDYLRGPGEMMGRKIYRRASNQLVNAVVQGTCATIMKRSILRVREAIKGMDARFMIPIHDEQVFSVHHSIVPEFVQLVRSIMIDHKDLFPTLMLEATPAVGRTFEPYSGKAKGGQIELFEPPKFLGLGDNPLNQDGVREVVNYLRKAA
jgi:DNA polymerase I-like protein with 3'-5' exonuclease and polymerase domains